MGTARRIASVGSRAPPPPSTPGSAAPGGEAGSPRLSGEAALERRRRLKSPEMSNGQNRRQYASPARQVGVNALQTEKSQYQYSVHSRALPFVALVRQNSSSLHHYQSCCNYSNHTYVQFIHNAHGATDQKPQKSLKGDITRHNIA